MRKSTFAVVACAVILVAATASANIGSYSFSATVMSAGDVIAGDITASTSGATAPDTLDYLSNWMWIGTYPGSSYVTADNEWTYRGSMSPFELSSTFVATGLPLGDYVVWVGGWAMSNVVGGGWTTGSATSYIYSVESVGDVAAIPTVSHIGMLILGVLLAGTGVFLLRRA